MEELDWHAFQKNWLNRPINQVLDHNGLCAVYEEAYQLLKDIKSKPKSYQALKLAEMAEELLIQVLVSCQDLRSPWAVLRVKKASSEAGYCLLSAFLDHELHSLHLLKVVKQALFRTCRSMAIDSWQLEKFLNIKSLEAKFSTINQGPQPHLVWVGTYFELANLADELKRRNLISRKSPFFKIFKEGGWHVDVQWNQTFKLHLAYLVHYLHEHGLIRVRGQKGHFAIVENHFTTFEGTPLFQRGYLRKIKQKIIKNPVHYKDVISTVNQIIKAMR
jgi:hypothetical protein